MRVRKCVVKSLPEGWRERLTQETLRLGRARKAGYGEVVVSRAPEPKPPPPESSSGDSFTVWFTSDALLRAVRLGAGTTADDIVEALQAAFKKVGIGIASLSIDDRDAHVRCRRIESWAGRWNLPRPSMVAVKAGSCVRVQGSPPTEKQAQALEAEGIGDRRAEGYGEIRINHPLLATQTSNWWRRPRSFGAEVPQDNNAPRQPLLKKADFEPGGTLEGMQDFVGAVEDAAWRAAIKDAAFRFSVSEERRKNGLSWTPHPRPRGTPPMSQLGTLRTVMGDFKDRDLARVENWLERIARKNPDSNAWNRKAKGDDRTPKDKLQALLTEDSAVWNLLEGTHGNGDGDKDVAARRVWPALPVRDDRTLKAAFRLEAVRALILASIRAHKRDLERSPTGADSDDGSQSPPAEKGEVV